jgi:hypothetical protein
MRSASSSFSRSRLSALETAGSTWPLGRQLTDTMVEHRSRPICPLGQVVDGEGRTAYAVAPCAMLVNHPRMPMVCFGLSSPKPGAPCHSVFMRRTSAY